MNTNDKNQRKVYILSGIIMVGFIYLILLFSGVISFNTTNNTNNSTIESNESYIDSNIENKEEILGIIGLTENGYKRLNDELKTQYNLSGDNYIDYNFYDIAKIFIDLKGGEYQVKDIDKEELNKLIFNYSTANSIELENLESNGNKKHPCYEGTGSCFGISEENYKKVAAVYKLSENPSDVLQKYGDVYIINTFATIDNPREIKDIIRIKKDGDGVEVKYDVTLNTVSGYDQNGNGFKKLITYKFNKNNDNKYYLDKIIVEEK